tara:strand:- start:810 stop:1055 length:246 start_codon:yes stop_codon:yes gene_type:complete
MQPDAEYMEHKEKISLYNKSYYKDNKARILLKKKGLGELREGSEKYIRGYNNYIIGKESKKKPKQYQTLKKIKNTFIISFD